MFRDGVGESADGFMQSRSEGFDGQALEGLYQRMSKAVQTVSVADDALALYLIQNLAYLLGRILVMVQK